jgi:hypothetical protein
MYLYLGGISMSINSREISANRPISRTLETVLARIRSLPKEGIKNKDRFLAQLEMTCFDRLKANGLGFDAGLSRRGMGGSYMCADSAPKDGRAAGRRRHT